MRDGGVPTPTQPTPRPRTDGAPSDRQLLQRFVQGQDAAAFAGLIQRHGPMVLGVCRRVLNHQQEAEDAFQATFLVLVRRAATLERPDLLGNWLYGVAYRTAQKARARLARRRHHERRVLPMSPVEPTDHLQWQELRSVLDQELRELPPKYRTPLVLCYLQGLTNEEAARRLGWPTGSMSYRLARGRQMLRDRLRQRRQLMPGMILVALLKRHAAPEAVPADLAQATLRAALGQDSSLPPPVPPLPVRPLAAAAATASAAGLARVPVRRARSSLLLLLLLLALGFAGIAYLAFSGGYSNVARAAGITGWLAPADGSSSSGTGSCH
jgi:RNA polymerase sigma factor (sigma-70 family)